MAPKLYSGWILKSTHAVLNGPDIDAYGDCRSRKLEFLLRIYRDSL
jgi:hypothetical protein